MGTYVILGKVDNRVIAYPIIRALSLNGKVAVITDDRSYRRLYNGMENTGEVSGVDIFISTPYNNNSIEDCINQTGMKYDTIVYVTEQFMPSKLDGIISCIGVDTQLGEKEYRKELNKKDIDTNETKVDSDEITQESGFKDDMAVAKVTISFDAPKKIENRESIILRELNLKYVYGCEENKRLTVYPERAYNSKLAAIMQKAMQMDKKLALTLLTRKEFVTNNKK